MEFSSTLKSMKPLLIRDYIPNDDEVIKDNTVYCKVCGKPRYEKKDSAIFGGSYWAKTLCDCEKAKRDERLRREEAERLRAHYNAERYTSTVGKRFIDVRFSDPYYSTLNESQVSARKRLENFCRSSAQCYERGLGWYLYSENRGNSKTSLMACARNGLLDNGEPVVMVKQETIISAFRNDSELFQSIKKVKFLFIDDIGSGILNKYESAIIHEVIDYRYLNMMPTCFTANYTPDELRDKRGFEEQTTDRIKSLAYTIIHVQGESQRGL